MIEVYEKVLRENLSVKDTEREVRKILYAVNDEEEGKYYPLIKKKKLKELFKKVFAPQIEVDIVQTRVKVKITLIGKGNLRVTNAFLDKVLNVLQSLNKKE